MKRFYVQLLLLIILPPVAKAQIASFKNSVRVGIDYLSLDAPDDLGYRFLGQYARHVANDRIVLEAGLGYLQVENHRRLPNNYIFEGRPRKRITADLTASFDFIRNQHHALRLGVGPSVWYREDDLLLRADYSTQPGGGITDVKIENRPINEVNVGGHVITEYEYTTRDRITFGARFGYVNFKAGGISSLLGLTIGYRF
ncbi:hypothetical protein [Larkinella rosea]|uniref:Outer membrane protein beta-barrel domain-containing protein n=1 Tax=Larkinella rosea TaxID=2025312 RepID=A0A3P1BI25_9BACT|nr:hypothetical protein [Larkinella rosea]RRB00729.1 hypothetical protein EHT25_21265 [Larkinella rosea]